jgi:iron complex outermembrane receptor protein
VTLQRAAQGGVTLSPVSAEGLGDAAGGYAPRDASVGTRQPTPIMETPASVKVVTKEVIADQQALRVEEVLRNVSGVIYTDGPEQKAFTTRGFGSQFMIDGVSRSEFVGGSAQEWDLDTYNIERVEVLKGPASALYGRGNPGGTINVVTKQPLAEPYYAAMAAAGSHELFRGGFDVSGPIDAEKQFLYRVNGVAETADSFRDHVESDRYFVMPVLAWNVAPGSALRADVEYGRIEETPDSGLPRRFGEIVEGVPLERFVGEPTDYRIGEKLQARLFLDHEFQSGIGLHASTTLYRGWHDQLFTRGGSLQSDGRTLTRTVRDDETTNSSISAEISGTASFHTGPLNHSFVLGLNGDAKRTDAHFGTAPAAPIDIFDPVYGNDGPTGPFNNSNVMTDRWMLGGFAQDDIEIVDGLHLVGGVRYDYYEEEQDNNGVSPSDRIDHEVSPNAGVLYRPIEQLSVYATYAESFQSSGFTQTPDGTIIEPQRGALYEVGLKLAFFDERLMFNLAAFDQRRTNVPVSVGGGFSVATGEIRSRGVELDVTGEILPGWDVIGGVSVLDADILKDANPAAIGKDPANVPEVTASLWTAYTIQQGDLRGLGAAIGAQYVGTRHGDNINSYELDDYVRLDAALSYRFETFTLRAKVNNITDEEILVSQGGNFLFPGEPRSFLLSGEIRF